MNSGILNVVVDDLSEQERTLIEYHNFQLLAIRGVIEQFLIGSEFKYKEEHVQRILQENAEQNMILTLTVLEILRLRGYELSNLCKVSIFNLKDGIYRFIVMKGG